MQLAQLIAALSDPVVYSHPVASVEVRQTHISVVFLAGDYVYKVKKPVQLSFVDFSTLAAREHYCREEVRLNARLAPHVYLGVVPIVATGKGIRMDGAGDAIEWAVKMKRLPDDATLEHRLEHGQVDGDLIEAVARRIAGFHALAETNPRIAAFGRFDAVAANARDNLAQSQSHVGSTISRAVFARLQSATDAALIANRATIEARAARGMTRDTHGDLRLDHIYVSGDRDQEPTLTIIDCIEFNERFRFSDPVADIAFLAMDLKYAGRHDLARALTEAYFAASGDDEGRALLPFYTSYRAAVRAKVEGVRHAAAEVPAADRAAALARARGYWLLALGELEPPAEKPCLVLVAGLPGSGKSTLSAALARDGGFHVVRSDSVRKLLAGIAEEQPASAAFGAGIYTAEWNERTYAECLRRAEHLLFEGERVLFDASFRDERRRQAFLELAARWRVPVLLLVCEADAAVVRRRLAARQNDVSDADWATYVAAAEAWEPLAPATATLSRIINTSGPREQALAAAVAALAAFDLAAKPAAPAG